MAGHPAMDDRRLSGLAGEGLAPPPAVIDATDDYLEAEDALSRWIKERCKAIGYGGTESRTLYHGWRDWAYTAGEDPGSEKRFSQALEAKGYRKDPKARHSTFMGIALDEPKRWMDGRE